MSPSALTSEDSCGGLANGAIRVAALRSEIASSRWAPSFLEGPPLPLAWPTPNSGLQTPAPPQALQW